jgi:pimeloyl-ACP methyl ester carboxylesterase
MGAYVATRLAEEHPERAAALVLVDGGPSLDAVSPEAAALMRAVIVGPALARQAMPHGSTDSWLDFWRQHPAFVDAWNKDVECYVLHDLVVDAGSVGYRINLNAVEADSDDMLSDPASRTSMDRVDLPLTLVRASQGTLGDENPMIPCSVLEAFTAEHPAAHVEALEDVNHYTVILGDSPGPGRVAAAIEAAARIAR